MTKILFLIPTLMHGGAEKVLVNLVNNLDQEKYDITLYSIFDGGVNKQFLNKNIQYQSKFKKVFRGNSQLMKLLAPKVLYNYFIKEEYDILVSYLEGPAARIISGCANPKTKKIAWIHSDTLTESLASVGFRNFAEAKKLYNQFDHIVGVSKNVVNSFKKTLQPSVPLHVLYNVNETEKIRLLARESVPYQFPENILNICSVGKISSNKGFDRLLDVHYQLMKEGFPHQINIMGIGEDQAQLEKRVKELGLEDSFKLLGFHKNPYQYMSKCDLYVCASYREGFSTAVTEALIVGLPVVSTNCSGAHELLGENNEYGIVTENSTEGLYKGLKDMISNPERLAHYTNQSKLRGSFFSTENTVQATDEFFDFLS